MFSKLFDSKVFAFRAEQCECKVETQLIPFIHFHMDREEYERSLRKGAQELEPEEGIGDSFHTL